MQTNRKKSRKGSYMARKQNRLGYFFMSPWILGFVVFTLIPFIMTIILSFCSVSSTIKGYELSFIGFDNYYTAFFRNTEFVPALISFLGMVIPYTFIIIVISFILAYLLNKYINVRHYRDLWITHSKIKSHIDWRMMVFIKEYETQKTKMKPEESEALLESLQKSFIDDMCEFYNTSSIEVSEKVMSKDENMFQEILSIFSKEKS